MRNLLLLLICACSLSAVEPPVEPPTYVCQRTQAPLHIDGCGNEIPWQNALVLAPLRDIEGPTIEHTCTIRMLWDDEYLYVLADMQEPHLWATLTQRDSVIYRDPDFEIFIDAEGSGRNYIELEVNALNTIWDLFLTAPYHSTNQVLHDWNIPGLKSAVSLRGTLNDPSDIDEGWSVEVAIPWTSITAHSHQSRRCKPPTPGTILRMNFSRVNWQVSPDPTAPHGYSKRTATDGSPLPESNHVWAPTGIINIHYPEHWGYVKLSAHPADGTFESMAVPATHSAQVRLCRYYNAQLRQRAQHGAFSAGLSSPGITPLYVDADHFIAKTTSTDGTELSIDHNGQLRFLPGSGTHPPLYLWVQGNKHPDNPAWWSRHFTELAQAGIHAVIIGGGTEQIAQLTPLAREQGLKVYAWLWTLNRPQDSTALQHPEWYAVNRHGKSCHAPADRPFVEYYQFLCPNHPEVIRHLLNKVDELAAIPGLSGIQLDYLRLPDVILPRGLWEKYGLDMSQELPEYDYCYCERCRTAFLSNSQIHDRTAQNWRVFRRQSVARVANILCERIRQHHLQAACAVFPTPQIAAELVRQDWSLFRLDLALPMLYNAFYNEPEQWIATCTEQAAQQTEHRLPLAPGLHLPDLNADSLRAHLEGLQLLYTAGIGLFCDDDLTPEMLRSLRQWSEGKRKNADRPTPPSVPTD